MVNYSCNNCGKQFTRKSNYECHINRKYKCTGEINLVNDTENNIIEKLEAKLDEKDKLILSLIDDKDKIANEKDKLILSLIDDKDKVASEKDKIIMSLIEKLMMNNIPVAATDSTNSILKSSLNNNSNNNSNNNTNSNNNSNNNTYNYVSANYKDAMNIEDCFNKKRITKDMIKECENMYYPDGAKYIIKTLCDIGEAKRPIHCADSSRRNFVVKTNNEWIKDIGCSKIKDNILPVIDGIYKNIFKEQHKKTNDDVAFINNQNFLLVKNESKRFNKMIDDTSTFFTLKK